SPGFTTPVPTTYAPTGNVIEDLKGKWANAFGTDVNMVGIVMGSFVVAFFMGVGGYVTKGNWLAVLGGGGFGVIFSTALTLLPIWIFFAMIIVCLAVVVLKMRSGSEG